MKGVKMAAKKKKPKRIVGKKQDYTAQFNKLYHEIRGKPSAEKKQAYMQFYRRIAKVADQRLVEIENLAKKPGYKKVKQWAYRVAMREIKGMYGEGAKRFNRKPPSDLRKLYKNINRVLQFLESPTSSKQGIQEVYEKRANTISEKYGVSVDWSNIGDLFESALYKKVDAKYGSKTAIQAIGIIQADKKKVQKALKEEKPISMHVEDIDLNRTVNNFLHYYKKDLKSLLKKI